MNLILTVLLLIPSLFDSDKEAIKEIDSIFRHATVHYNNLNLDSTRTLIQKAHLESRQIGYTYGEGRSLVFLGAIADVEGRSDKAVSYLLDALDRFRLVGSNKALFYQAEICATLGKIFRQHNDILSAIDFYQQGIGFAVATNNTITLRKLLYNQSIAYRRHGDPMKAMDVLSQSMDFIPKGDATIKQRTYNQLGLIYYEQEEYDKAREWYNKMIRLDSAKSQPQYYRGQAYHNVALTYQRENDTFNTWKYYQLAIKEKEPLGNAEKIFLTYRDMAELALLEGQIKDALNYAHKALVLIDQVPKTPENYNLYLILSECTEESDPAKALTYTKQYISEMESFHARQKKLLDEAKQYKVRLAALSYEKEALTEKYDRNVFIGTIILSLSGIFMAIGVFKMFQNPIKYRYSFYKKHKKKLQQEEAQKQILEHKKSTEKHLKDLEETRKLLEDQKSK